MRRDGLRDRVRRLIERLERRHDRAVRPLLAGGEEPAASVLIDAEPVVREAAVRRQHAVHGDGAHLAGFAGGRAVARRQDPDDVIHRREKAQRLRIERGGPFQPGQHDEGDRGGVDSVVVAHRPIRIVERVQVVERARADGAHLERRSVGGRGPGDVPGQLEGAAVRNLEEVAGRGAVLGQERSGRARRAGRRDPRVSKVAVQRRRVDEPEQNSDPVDAAALQRAHRDLHGARGRRQRHAEERTVDEPRRRIDPARLRHLQDGIVNVADSRQIVGDRNGGTGHYRGNDRRVQRAGGGVRRSEGQREARPGELHTALAGDVGEVHRPRRGGRQRQPGCAEDLLG